MKKQMISVSDGRRCVYATEPRGLPQLFCVHGGMGLSSDSLMTGLERLQSVFDLIFIDQRGCGESTPASNGRYDLSDFANDVVEVVHALKSDVPRGIFGHSMGGMIAIEALANHPDLFDFAILSNTALNDEWRKSSGESARKLDDPALDEANAMFDKAPTRDDLIRDVAIGYGPLYFPELSPTEAKAAMANFTYRAATIEYTSSQVYPGMNLAIEVEKISVPAFVIAGAKDIVVPRFCQEALVAALSAAKLGVVNNAGHFPFVTEPVQVETLIKTWWNETRRKIQ